MSSFNPFKSFDFASGGAPKKSAPFNRPAPVQDDAIESFISSRSPSEQSLLRDFQRLGEGVDPYEDAKRQGYQVQGPWAKRQGRGGGFYSTTGGAEKTPFMPYKNFGSKPEIPPIYINAALQDMANVQQEADRKYGEIQDMISQQEDFLNNMLGGFVGFGKEMFDKGEREGSQITDMMGKSFEEYKKGIPGAEKRIDESLARMREGFASADRDITSAYGGMDQAASWMEGEIKRYDDEAVQDSVQQAFATTRQLQQLKLQSMRTRADGTVPDEASAAVEYQNAAQQIRERADSIITETNAKWQQIRTGLSQNVAQMKQAAAAMRMQGSQQRAANARSQFESEMTGEQMKKQLRDDLMANAERQAAAVKMSSDIKMAYATFAMAGIQAALKDYQTGKEKIAEWKMQNTKSVPSLMGAVMTMLQLRGVVNPTNPGMAGGGGGGGGGLPPEMPVANQTPPAAPPSTPAAPKANLPRSSKPAPVRTPPTPSPQAQYLNKYRKPGMINKLPSFMYKGGWGTGRATNPKQVSTRDRKVRNVK